ncbi:hypothetical protein [Shimia sp.]|uniref:hypothetical protein n=1 Tax=Shimia sp. TaxID=1954381 RepID=UPI00329785BA
MTKVFWGSFGAALLVYLVMVLWSLPFIAEQADGLVPFDMRPLGYTPEEARTFITALSEEGRVFYLDVQHMLDFIYPALLAAMLIIGLQLVFPRRWAMGLGFIALLGAASDYLENYMVSVMLTTPVDALSDNLVGLAQFWTLSKSAAATICSVALLFGGARLAVRRWFL